MQVRNAANIVVQPEYGDDGMDPVAMEGKRGEPVALQQKLAIVKAMSPKQHSSKLAPLPAAFKAAVAQELAALDKMPASNGAVQFCSQAFRASLELFLEEKVIFNAGLFNCSSGKASMLALTLREDYGALQVLSWEGM